MTAPIVHGVVRVGDEVQLTLGSPGTCYTAKLDVHKAREIAECLEQAAEHREGCLHQATGAQAPV